VRPEERRTDDRRRRGGAVQAPAHGVLHASEGEPGFEERFRTATTFRTSRLRLETRQASG
jgi:hypothetical protein